MKGVVKMKGQKSYEYDAQLKEFKKGQRAKRDKRRNSRDIKRSYSDED